MGYEFRSLSAPIRVGPLTLKNRIYSSGHAEAMAEGGRPYVGQEVGITSIAPLYARLFAKGVVLTPCTELRAVEGSTVIVANVYSRAERRIESVDTVVLAMGSRSTDGLYRALKGHVPELHAAGDCVAPRSIHQAILDGTRVARAI